MIVLKNLSEAAARAIEIPSTVNMIVLKNLSEAAVLDVLSKVSKMTGIVQLHFEGIWVNTLDKAATYLRTHPKPGLKISCDHPVYQREFNFIIQQWHMQHPAASAASARLPRLQQRAAPKPTAARSKRKKAHKNTVSRQALQKEQKRMQAQIEQQAQTLTQMQQQMGQQTQILAQMQQQMGLQALAQMPVQMQEQTPRGIKRENDGSSDGGRPEKYSRPAVSSASESAEGVSPDATVTGDTSSSTPGLKWLSAAVIKQEPVEEQQAPNLEYTQQQSP